MILTRSELHHYRSIVGLQVQYAQRGDSHKVMELQKKLEKWIASVAKQKISLAGGKVSDLEWSDEGLAQYRAHCAVGMVKADRGFEEWSAEQIKIEQWVSDYIQQAVFQATVILKSK